MDSSGLNQLSLIDHAETDADGGSQFDIQRKEAEEAEMAAALKEVERMRLEMQRAAERVETAEGVDVEGTVVKRKKKKQKPKVQVEGVVEGGTGDEQKVSEDVAVVKRKKKKKKKRPIHEAAEADS